MLDPPGPLDDDRPPTPPSPDDRLWRHPSEVAAQARAAAAATSAATAPAVAGAAAPALRPLRGQRFSLGTVVVAGSLGAFAMFASLVALGLVTGMPVDAPVDEVVAATSSPDTSPAPTPVPDGVVALRATTPSGVDYGVGLVVDDGGDLVTTLTLDVAAGSTVSVGRDATSWTPATVVATDPTTGLSVVRPDTPTATTPATVARPRLSQDVRMVRPGAGPAAVLADLGSTRVSGTNATLQTSTVACVGLTTLTSPRRTGPSEVAVAGEDDAVVGLVVPDDDDPEDEVSYAMAADVAVDVARQLLDDGRALHGGFDATLVPDGDGALLLVTAVQPGGRAERAGLRPGDEVLTVDGRRVHSLDDAAGALLGRAPGDSVVVVVRRGQRQTTVRVVLASAPSAARPVATDVATDVVAVSTTSVG